MAFDGFFTRSMVNELREELVGGRISKIYQPYEQEIQLIVRNNRTNYRLHASIHPVYYRLHLTDEKPNNPKQAPLFAMLLRKNLEGAQILDFEQIDNDRIIRISATGRDDFGDVHQFHLYFELMGRHSNIVLVNPNDNNKIIDCIKHVPAYQNSYRLLLPGAEYRLPPSQEDQVNLFELGQSDLMTFASTQAQDLSSGKGSKIIQGLGREAANSLKYWISDEGYTPYNALRELMDSVMTPTPTLHETDDKMHFYYRDLPIWDNERRHFDKLSELVEYYYSQKVRFDRVHQVSGDLISRLEQILKRNNNKLNNLEKDRHTASSADEYKLKGELINAYMYQINKGDKSAQLENYYDDNKVLEVSLDPRLSPNENSQKYYKKYAKYRDSLKYIDRQERITKEENDYLESVLVQVEQADIEDLMDIRHELEDQGYFFKNKKNQKKRQQTKSKPRQYVSSDGVPIYVGRNNKQNDELSMKKASKDHWWFHTKDIPGSHVIVLSDKPSDQTKTEAAEIAAFYSKSRSSANVPVDTVQVKNLRKPNGAKPGYVIYEGQETLFVTPKEVNIQKLEK
ncbi:NFACT family protein [Aerococcaceae bacterium DSM 111176]|nr:NFACT family protein [Aerococcaceae bacterium DSM 111176]